MRRFLIFALLFGISSVALAYEPGTNVLRFKLPGGNGGPLLQAAPYSSPSGTTAPPYDLQFTQFDSIALDPGGNGGTITATFDQVDPDTGTVVGQTIKTSHFNADELGRLAVYAPYASPVDLAAAGTTYKTNRTTGQLWSPGEPLPGYAGGWMTTTCYYRCADMPYATAQDAINATWADWTQRWSPSYCYILRRAANGNYSMQYSCGAIGGTSIYFDTNYAPLVPVTDATGYLTELNVDEAGWNGTLVQYPSIPSPFANKF